MAKGQDDGAEGGALRNWSALRAIVNAIDAIDEIGRSRRGIGVRELARVLRLTPATALRVLLSLEECRVVRNDPETHRYFLDTRLLEVVAAQKRTSSLGEIARRHMLHLQEDRKSVG